MDPMNDPLARLLQAAARAPRDLPASAPSAVERKVLAHWRQLAHKTGDDAQLLLPVLRWAALCACLLMIVSIAFSVEFGSRGETDEVAYANSAVDLTLLP
jgi:hypothetical protein